MYNSIKQVFLSEIVISCVQFEDLDIYIYMCVCTQAVFTYSVPLVRTKCENFTMFPFSAARLVFTCVSGPCAAPLSNTFP